MREAIKNFPKQLDYEPVIENERRLKRGEKIIITGMGGSNLIGGIIAIRKPALEVVEHRNYGLPTLPNRELKKSLIIASSYSGNTEETISAFLAAVKRGLNVAAVSVGGKLLELARKHKKPYVQLPHNSIPPRLAIGLSLKAVLKLAGEKELLKETNEAALLLKISELERAGKALAKKLKGHAPIIYSSQRNLPIAYNWKIKFNETGKIPAFVNQFPELNHNEMIGFDLVAANRELSKPFYFLFLKDLADHPRISKRMNVTERLYWERNLPVEVLVLGGKTVFHKIFSSLLMADWTAYYTALEYGVDPEAVPMIEEFKKLIR